MITLTVNDHTHTVNADPQTPLLYVLSEHIGMISLTFGCGVAACGACAVHVNGRSRRACELPLAAVAGARIVTLEGLAASEGLPAGELHPVQKAWIESQVPPCDCRQSGLMMAAAALLTENPDPSDTEIDAAIASLCPCGIHPRVRHAIRSLAERMKAW